LNSTGHDRQAKLSSCGRDQQALLLRRLGREQAFPKHAGVAGFAVVDARKRLPAASAAG